MAVSLRYLILFAGALLALAPARAQSPAGGAREFTVLAGGEAEWNGIALQRSATERAELAFSPRRRSAPLASPGETLVFTRLRTDPATGRPAPVAVARATWPAGVRKALLVFVPRATPGPGGMEFDVLAADDGAEAFPSGTARFINLAPVPLLAKIGDRETQVTPGFSPVFRTVDPAKPGQEAVALALGVRNADGSATALYLGPLETRAGVRTLILVQPPRTADSRKVRVNVIAQTVPAPPAK